MALAIPDLSVPPVILKVIFLPEVRYPPRLFLVLSKKKLIRVMAAGASLKLYFPGG